MRLAMARWLHWEKFLFVATTEAWIQLPYSLSWRALSTGVPEISISSVHCGRTLIWRFRGLICMGIWTVTDLWSINGSLRQG